MKHFILVAVLAACSATPKVQSTTAALTSPTSGCVSPTDYGAVASPTHTTVDSPDARLAWEAAKAEALRRGGEVCWPSGHFRVSRAPTGSYNRFAALSIHEPNMFVHGTGPTSTFIEVVGDQGVATLSVISLDPGSKNVKISDMAIDTMGAFNTDEQTHAIQLGSGVCATIANPDGTRTCPLGGVEDVRLEHIQFQHGYVKNPDGTQSRKGDCIRLLGNTPDTAVTGITISDIVFDKCARSAISEQRNVFSLTISRNHFKPNAWDQAVDSEPSGGANDHVSRLIITDNTFDEDTSITQGDASLSVTGIGGTYNLVIIANNVFNGRGIFLYRLSDATIIGNVFKTVNKSGYGVIDMENVANQVNIGGNTMHRTGFDGPLIRIEPHSGGFPVGYNIHDNTMLNDTAGSGIAMEGASQMSIVNNDMTWSVQASQGHGIYLRSTVAVADDVLIEANRIRAPLLYSGITLAASPQPFEVVSVIGNQVRGAIRGLYCAQSAAGLFHQFIVHVGNRYDTQPQCVASFVQSWP